MVSGIFTAFLAGLSAAIANLCIRRNLTAGGSPSNYFVVQVSFSCLLSIPLNPLRTGCWTAEPVTVGLGVIGGGLLGTMLWSMGRALQSGPAGLTFATINSATVVPAILMALLFGEAYGHGYRAIQGVGSALVALGLFWAGWEAQMPTRKIRWLGWTGLALLLHSLLLSLLQWRALLLKGDLPEHPLLPWQLSARAEGWFMPVLLLIAALFQLPAQLSHPIHRITRDEWRWACYGGLASGLSAACLIWAPERAHPWENGVIYPVFAVTLVLATTLWSQLLYRERVNWRAGGLSLAGIFLGTLSSASHRE
jgi:uncharacterized membrane protein